MSPPWKRPLQSFTAPKSLGGITVYHDFDWEALFGHRRKLFPGAKKLAAQAREACPAGKTPALLLTDQPLAERFFRLIQTADAAVLVAQPEAVFARRERVTGSFQIVLGGSPSGALGKLVADRSTIYFDWDPCTTGPCREDPAAHRRVRESLWAEWAPESPQWLGSGERMVAALGALTERGRLCVWTGPAWDEQLFLWRVLDCLERLGTDPAGVDLAVVPDEPALAPDRGSIRHCGPRQLWNLWRLRTHLEAEVLARGAALWRAFVAPTPARLAALCAKEQPPPLFPRVDELGALLPGRSATGLGLSRLDRALLGPFREGPGRPFCVVQRNQEAWMELMDHFGDVLLVDRIVAWSQAPQPALSMEGDAEESHWNVFRLTPHGERLLAEGFRDPSEHLPLPFGGYANDGRAPVWVCLEGDEARVAPL